MGSMEYQVRSDGPADSLSKFFKIKRAWMRPMRGGDWVIKRFGKDHG